MANTTWTPPFHGVTHGNVQGKRSYATVSDYDTFAELSLWFYGCGLRPIKQTHDTAQQAREAAEAWLADPTRV